MEDVPLDHEGLEDLLLRIHVSHVCHYKLLHCPVLADDLGEYGIALHVFTNIRVTHLFKLNFFQLVLTRVRSRLR